MPLFAKLLGGGLGPRALLKAKIQCAQTRLAR